LLCAFLAPLEAVGAAVGCHDLAVDGVDSRRIAVVFD
jgi:hypothetical protein